MPESPACPSCGRRPVPRWRPFCSERCKLADLGRWLSGGYRIPGASSGATGADDDDADAPRDSEPDR